MSRDEEISAQDIVLRKASRVYRAASRIQYTLLNSATIDYDHPDIDEIQDSIHSAYVELSHAIALLRGVEE